MLSTTASTRPGVQTLSPARLKHLVYPLVGNAPIELRDGGRDGVRGLRLRVSATKATWNLAIRDSVGRSRRFSLGEYPDLSLSDARDKARAERQRVRDGADPVAEDRAKRAKAEVDKVATLVALLDLYGRKVGAGRRSWAGAMRPAIEHVFKAALRRPVAELTRTELQVIATSHPRAGGAATAVRCLRPVLRWAEENGFAPDGLARIKPPAKVQRRKRVLSRDELARLLPALHDSTKPHAKLMLFLLYTLARRDEAASAKWRDMDMLAKTWTIPMTKNGETHVVPLSRQATDLLSAIRPASAGPDDLVFRAAARAFTGKRATLYVEDAGRRYVHDKLGRKYVGGKLSNWDRETKAIQETSKTDGWQRHDLRRTGATMLGEMGVLPDIIEAALNHVSIHSQIAAIYNRSRYRPQVAAALQQLADCYDGIQTGGAEIVPLARPAA